MVEDEMKIEMTFMKVNIKEIERERERERGGRRIGRANRAHTVHRLSNPLLRGNEIPLEISLCLSRKDDRLQ